MSRKKPQLTKTGSVRKRAPGAGRPSMGRTSQPPKIKPEAMSIFREIAGFRKTTVAGSIELCATLGIDALEGRPMDPTLYRYDPDPPKKPRSRKGQNAELSHRP